jgi:eukaryotic-like serine/threonine-protein kinase
MDESESMTGRDAEHPRPPSPVPAPTPPITRGVVTPTGTSSSGPPSGKKSRWWLWTIVGIVAALVIAAIVLTGVLFGGGVEVPDLAGLSSPEASAALDEAGLVLGTVVYTVGLPPGTEENTVVGQLPPAGRRVEKGTTVDVIVARGEQVATVPDVVGKTETEAGQILADAGFETKVARVEDEAAAGIVVDQSPAAGARIAPGSEVALLVSAGPVATLVPNVIGKSQQEATTVLQEVGFVVEAIATYDDQVEEGRVISQAPEAGTVADPGALATIVVSKGQNPEARVPSVVGKAEADAAKTLEDAGFQVVSTTSYSASVPAGIVIGQDPQAETTALVGSAVTMTVSMGPEPPLTATVPDVLGKTETEARQILAGAGYEVAVARAYSDQVDKDVVAAQVPVAGSITEPGISVGIIVSDGPRPDQGFVVVPDVTGLTLEDATTALVEAGLKVVSFEWFTQLVPQGEVFAQLPPSGYAVAPESTVLVIVSKGPYLQVNPL